jgi:hypothetical protein
MNMVKDRPAWPNHPAGDEQLEPLKAYVANCLAAEIKRQAASTADADLDDCIGADLIGMELAELERRSR